jgi:hypothetical protein
MILAPAAAERNTRTAAEEWLDSGGRIQESEFRIQNSEFGSQEPRARSQELQNLIIPSELEQFALEAAEASARASSASLSGFFSDAVNLNSGF